MTKGFVALTTGGRFLELTEVLVKSLLQFSEYPITIFAINTEVPFKYPNMDPIIRKDINATDFESIVYEKFVAAYSSPYDVTVMLDVDMVVNKGIDTLLTEAETVGVYPHCVQHPGDPQVQGDLMRLLGVEKQTLPYIHSDTFLYTNATKPFLQDCYKTAMHLQSIGFHPPFHDETVLNVKLCSVGATEYSKLYDPYFECIHNYLAGEVANPHCHLFSLDRTFIFHGCKNPKYAEGILNKLVAFHGQPVKGPK